MSILECVVLLFLIFSLFIMDLCFISLLVSKIQTIKYKRNIEKKAEELKEELLSLAKECENCENDYCDDDDNNDECDIEEKDEINYNSFDVKALKKMAKDKGIKGYYNMKKDELVARLSK